MGAAVPLVVRDLDNIASKWAERASASSSYYAHGIENPRVPWSKATLNAVERWHRAITAPQVKQTFERGVKGAGDKRWQENAKSKGPARYAEGVAVAKQQFKDRFEPYHKIIKTILLAPRGPRGSEQNLQRVAQVARALHEAKLKGVAAAG